MKPRLRHLLAAAFIFIATVPLLILGSWVQKTALEKELAAVSEKHLLLAQNITAALDRYALDTKAAFAFFAQSAGSDRPSAAAEELARSLGFRHFCIIDDEGRVTFRLKGSDELGDLFPAPTLNRLRPAFDNPDATFSGVMADAKGRPTIFLTHRLGPGRIAIGALDLGYIRQVQKAITFGRKGHSAIVDRSGNLIAHPRPDWQRQMKNIAKVKPVAKMMAGETGVTNFFAPALNKDMITGFTTVPSTGWGVMVPQPMEELEERANDVRRIALALIVFGLLVAAVLSWLLSGLLVRPVEAVVRTARGIADGNLESRVPKPSRFAPTEFLELGTVFNAMARDVATVMIQRQRVEKELRQAHDELETRVEERTRALTEEISERKRAEESNLRLAAAIEGLSENFALYGPDDRLIMCNKGYRETNEAIAEATTPGTLFEDHLRAMVEKGLAPESVGREEEWLRERLERHRNPKGPFELQRQDGIWLLVHDQRMPDGSTATISADISERKRAEEELEHQKTLFEAVFRDVPDAMVLTDTDRSIVMCNPALTRTFGYQADEVLDRKTEILYESPEEFERQGRLRYNLSAEEKLEPYVVNYKRKDGEIFPGETVGAPIRDKDGNTLGFVGVIRDVTERTRAEEALSKSEGRLRGAIASLQEGFALFDADDRLVALNDEYLRVSPAAGEILEKGGTFEDVIKANIAHGVIVESVGREEAFLKERLEQHRNPKGPIIRRFTDGTWYMISEVKTPEGGTALSFIDITILKEAEVALKESRKRFKDFAEVASDWFWEMDENLRFSYFSGRNFRVTGFSRDDLIGKTRREVTKEDLNDEKWRKHFADLEAHRPFHDFWYDLTTRDGDALCISISGTPIFDDDGNFKGYRGTGLDISAQVTAEEKLREAKEEAEFANRAKTEFLANMSHELRMPLNSVIGFSEILIAESFGPIENPKVREYVTDINESGLHLLQLINDILDVARIERGLLDLNEKKLDVPLLVASCQRLVNDRAFDAGLELTADVAKSLPALLADELRTKQILLNLLSNAIKFTPEGGKVKLRVAIDADNRFRLSVSDTGIGIAPENIDRALSDFGQVDGSLTRKHDGAGLGLPLSKKLTELHGGELLIESELGAGTTVTVLFPKDRTVPLS